MKWKIGGHDMDFNPVIMDENDATIAICCSTISEFEPSPEDALKHATIIAMAPELRDVVQELADLDGVTHPIELTLKAKQLINQII